MADKPDYEEPKITTSFSLTDIARQELQELANFYGLKSRSDLLEQLSRGLIPGVLWLKQEQKEVVLEALEYYIKEQEKLIVEEEGKRDKKEEWSEEFTLLTNIKIATLKLIIYRLKGDGENEEVSILKKVQGKLKKEKERG